MTTPPSSAKLLGYFCVQAIRAQLYGMIGGRIHVVECILLLLGYCHMGGAWPEQMVDPSICSSEHDVSMCFSEHAGTLLMSWRSWPEPVSRVVDVLHRRVEEEGLLGVEYCLGGCGIGHGRLGPLSLDNRIFPFFLRDVICIEILPLSLGSSETPFCPSWLLSSLRQDKSIGLETGSWRQDPDQGAETQTRGMNLEPGDRNLEAGSCSNLFMEYFSPTTRMLRLFLLST
ncbi:hypothetical protein F2Q68_00015262 [Brassica cretica]|uniref:Uncharacterized protein n=1 Tax=Brassica cretica TaxID=69181 RepID=A0A8S9HD75_BRACR|nr:hypothetical protein F2Q68_00015262 [Brassica cretica]